MSVCSGVLLLRNAEAEEEEVRPQQATNLGTAEVKNEARGVEGRKRFWIGGGEVL